jgi:hypothetical protein
MTKATDGFRPETVVAIDAVEGALAVAMSRVGAEDVRFVRTVRRFGLNADQAMA